MRTVIIIIIIMAKQQGLKGIAAYGWLLGDTTYQDDAGARACVFLEISKKV